MIVRHLAFLLVLGSALSASANLIDFDNRKGVVGDAYLLSDGVSFKDGESFLYPGTPSGPYALALLSETLVVSSPVNDLVAGVSFRYASNSVAANPRLPSPSLTVYSGPNGTGATIASLLLPDTGSTTTFLLAALSFSSPARSFVVRDESYSHMVLDDLAFTSQPVPEPSAFAALGLGAATLLRRRRK